MSENTAFDPNAPEGATGGVGSQYLSRKDAKWILGSAVVLGLLMTPIYFYMKEKAYKASCVKNMNGMMEALMVYSSNHDDRYPPIHNGGASPTVDAKGLPYTWISDIYDLKADRISFVCQSASPEEASMSLDPATGEPIPSTYGFYAPYSTYSTALVDNPDNVVVLAETSNGGAESSFDPMPFDGSKWDGYAICWDNSNEWPDEQTSAVTRLALRGTKDGPKGVDKAVGRHNTSIHAITASRLLLNLKPGSMVTDYNRARFTLTGNWQEPVNRQR
ncbi:MAG TPA: hypothetical protein VK171_09030 [Fimbriimonas sp.]|nr:hypothetical protein [Fimbriimonas sp.]